MPNQELIDFIKKSKAAGQTDEQVKSALKQSGWQETDIDDGFKSISISAPAQNYSDVLYRNKQGSNFEVSENKSSKKLVVAIIVIFILLAGGAFGFYYFNKFETLPAAPSKTSEESQGEIAKPKSPKERFLDFKSALENAATYEEVSNLAKQYMSKTTDTKALGYEQINLSTEQKNQLLAMLKTTPPLVKDISDISEEINGASGKLIIKTKDNKLCGLPLFLEDGQWKFGIMDCKESVATQPTQPQPQNPLASTITSCGSIKYTNIMNIDARTSTETSALNCMATALTNCSSKALMVNRVQTTTYQVEGKESQYCNISRNAGLKTTCRIPLTYISNYRQKYASPNADDIFLQTILSSIDADGKITDGRTGQTTTEFICQ